MEYRVEILGGALRGAKPEELEALLNQMGEQDWTLSERAHPAPDASR